MIKEGNRSKAKDWGNYKATFEINPQNLLPEYIS
jgi:hypothetical protein